MSHTVHEAAGGEEQAAAGGDRQEETTEASASPDGRQEDAAQPESAGGGPEAMTAPEAEDSAEPARTENEAESGRLAELEEEVKGLKAQVDEYRDRLLRMQADFDNFRKRTLREKEDLAKYASVQLIGQLLPVLDNFERALAASEGNKDPEALRKGVDMIYRQFFQVLEQEGLKPVPTVGEPFNPELHEAVMQVESEEHGEGIVVEELQKGYFIKDKVLRPAMVKVSS